MRTCGFDSGERIRDGTVPKSGERINTAVTTRRPRIKEGTGSAPRPPPLRESGFVRLRADVRTLWLSELVQLHDLTARDERSVLAVLSVLRNWIRLGSPRGCEFRLYFTLSSDKSSTNSIPRFCFIKKGGELWLPLLVCWLS